MEKKRPVQWRSTTIVKMLKRESLLGWKIHQGAPVRDEQSNPVMATETPVLTCEEFDHIGTLLAPEPDTKRAPQQQGRNFLAAAGDPLFRVPAHGDTWVRPRARTERRPPGTKPTWRRRPNMP